MKPSNHILKPNRNRGVTLIELLVVVSIISVLTAIMIPRLRVINKDRNIREAARVAGSALAKVNSRAVDEGVAGLIIERNNNFVDANGVYFAATRMYAMRKLPPYAGDDYNDTARVTSGGGPGEMVVSIKLPLEHIQDVRPLIKPGDQIRLNHSSVLYDIARVDPPVFGKLILRVSLGLNPGYGAVRPKLAPGDYPFVIYRQPRKLESSRVDLPEGYYIDLRLSGPLVPTPSTPPAPPNWERGSVFDAVTGPDDTVQLFFNGSGEINRYTYTLENGDWISAIPTDAFYFFVSAYEPESTISPLFSPSAMWVTIDKSTGGVNVAYNAPPQAGLTGEQQIKYARGFGETRQSADQ